MRPPNSASSLQLDLPARQQWEGNHGYCGEVSLICAGLYYGQYVSQYDARAIACAGLDQTLEASQLLLGVNDADAAARMRLDHRPWDASSGGSAKDFLAWVKQQLGRRHPVAIGVFMNQRLFYGATEPLAGDSEYDHIVPVVGIGTTAPQATAYPPPEDTLIFSDNGLWAPDGAPPPYLFEYPFTTLLASRSAANARSAVYSLNESLNYGLAITGVADADGDTLPVRVRTDLQAEPPIADGSAQRPPAVPLQLTVTVSGLQPGVDYRLYRYDRFAAVPDRGFNAAAGGAARTWDLRLSTGTSYVVRETLRSDEIAVYRAVRATAP
jgi:hypothetical protein